MEDAPNICEFCLGRPPDHLNEHGRIAASVEKDRMPLGAISPQGSAFTVGQPARNWPLKAIVYETARPRDSPEPPPVALCLSARSRLSLNLFYPIVFFG